MIKTFFAILLLTFILKPLNAQWEIMNEGFQGSWFSIMDFVDDDVGWISDRNGSLQMTTDGGESWEIIFENDSILFEAIAFIDHNIGWAISSNMISTWVLNGSLCPRQESEIDLFSSSWVNDPLAACPAFHQA